MVRGHSAKRMSRRLPMVVFFNIVNISALNEMNIWLKFQTTLKFKNRTRCSFSPYYIGSLITGIHLMAIHPFRDLWRPSLVLFQNEQHKEMLPTLFQKETGSQRSTATNANHGSIRSKHSVMQNMDSMKSVESNCNGCLHLFRWNVVMLYQTFHFFLEFHSFIPNYKNVYILVSESMYLYLLVIL